jgi:chaperonin cofactor prefoldin
MIRWKEAMEWLCSQDGEMAEETIEMIRELNTMVECLKMYTAVAERKDKRLKDEIAELKRRLGEE